MGADEAIGTSNKYSLEIIHSVNVLIFINNNFLIYAPSVLCSPTSNLKCNLASRTVYKFKHELRASNFSLKSV